MAVGHPTLNQKSVEIGHTLTSAGFGFDPATIIKILTTVMGLFQNCKLPPKAAARRAARPRLLDRLRLKQVIADHASTQDTEALEAAVLDAGAELKESDVKAMYDELKNV